MKLIQSENVFSDVEFNNWAYIEDLKLEEKYLIEKYLDKKGKTIEAGTGGGRILIEMKKLGFEHLWGYDCEPNMIEVAKQRDKSKSIAFEFQDAVSLKYEDCSFDQAISLQQIMSFIQTDAERLNAFKEVHRILKPGGMALLSLLNFDARVRNPLYLFYLGYMSFLRNLVGSNRSMQYIPWLKHNGQPNWSALIDKSPYTYWYKIKETHQLLKEVGFEVVALGSNYQVRQGKMHTSSETLLKEHLESMLYFVCQKSTV